MPRMLSLSQPKKNFNESRKKRLHNVSGEEMVQLHDNHNIALMTTCQVSLVEAMLVFESHSDALLSLIFASAKQLIAI